MIDIEPLLADPHLAEQAFDWVETALARRQATPPDGAVLYPPLAAGLLISGLEVCEDYQCRCGWNLRVSGRDPRLKARLLAIAERPADDRFGDFRVLGAHDGSLWTVQIAGTDDFGLDAVVRLLLAPVER
ncbi:MAG: hypothetical protein U0556_02735 [Dehalococcoidia bacterium]